MTPFNWRKFAMRNKYGRAFAGPFAATFRQLLCKLELMLLLLSALNPQLSTVLAQGTAFTYQGRLNDGGTPAHGIYDLRFKLFEDSFGNTQAGSTVLTNGISVNSGLFTVTIDFGSGIFNGSNYWLEVSVRTNGAGGYTSLTPLQAVTPAPYAVFASTASNLSGTVSAAQLSGVVSSVNFSGTYGNAVTLSNAGNSFSGSFAGDGANITNVNAAALNGLGAGNFWQTSGNSGANPTNGAFIGTADSLPLEFKVNGTRVWRLEPLANSAPNVLGGSTSNRIEQPGSQGNVIVGGGAFATPPDLIHSNSQNTFLGTAWGSQVGPNAYGAVIGSGFNNIIGDGATYSFIGSGYNNWIYGYNSVIGGGRYNVIQTNALWSVLAGGTESTIGSNAFFAVIGGGAGNRVNESGSTIAGGQINSIGVYADHAFIGGGEYNSIVGSYFLPVYATIGGGYGNTVQTNTSYAAIPGGYSNSVAGSYSFAAGNQAQANHDGSFVWADSQNAPFASTTSNQFNVRAAGGVRFVTGGTGLTVDGQPASAPSANFVFADSGGIQAVASANVFQDINFAADLQIDGWQHAAGTSQYTNVQSGRYLVQYNAQLTTSNGNGTNAQVRATLNSAEISGTRAAVTLNALGEFVSVSRSFIASFNSSDILTFQLTGSGTGIRLSGSPGVSMTIIRIQ
jgi:hypothetical protein